MPSPFPGMDPWIESPGLYPDFHEGFIGSFRAALNRVLPPPFYAALATRVWLEESERGVIPDAQVLAGIGPVARRPARGGATLLEAAPLVRVPALRNAIEARESRIEIHRVGSPSPRLVASVELLSPVNKTPGALARGLYLAKQEELWLQGVHLVELDLLRRGTHSTRVPLANLHAGAGEITYHACLSRTDAPESHFLIPIALDQRLPVLPIPLTEGVADALIDCQAVFAQVYEEALYDRRIDYAQPCDPPLTAEQAAWAANILTPRSQ